MTATTTTIYRFVTVGTDGSPIAERAISVAAATAATLGVPLRIVSVWSDAGDDYEVAKAATGTGVELASAQGASDVTTSEPTGDVIDTLRHLGGEHPGGLLVVGGRGLDSPTERLGSNVANELTQSSPTDLLIVHEAGPVPYRSVALSTDGSTTANRAVKQGLALARSCPTRPPTTTSWSSATGG